MKLTGRCYCGELRYEAEGAPLFQAQCHCRECQYLSGGAENVFMAMPADGFRYVQGQPKTFSRSDLPDAVSREFCADCGTQIITRTPRNPQMVILKVGTLDDPSQFHGPQAAIWTADKQPWHIVPEGVPAFERFPGA